MAWASSVARFPLFNRPASTAAPSCSVTNAQTPSLAIRSRRGSPRRIATRRADATTVAVGSASAVVDGGMNVGNATAAVAASRTSTTSSSSNVTPRRTERRERVIRGEEPREVEGIGEGTIGTITPGLSTIDDPAR